MDGQDKTDDHKRKLVDLAKDLGDEVGKELKDLEEKRAKLDKERQTFADEKAALHDLNAKPNDILEINAGGRTFTTKRATLTLEEGSLLAAMFSGRWEKSLETDKHGNIFLNIDADCFAQVLHHLLVWELTGEQTNWHKVPAPEGKSVYFRAMLKYFALVKANVNCGSSDDLALRTPEEIRERRVAVAKAAEIARNPIKLWCPPSGHPAWFGRVDRAGLR